MIWLPWIYQYGVGGLLFSSILVFCHRKGAIDLKKPRDRWLVLSLVLGFLSFAALHGFWVYAVVREHHL